MLNNHIGIIEASFGDLDLNQKLFRVVNGADIRIAESIYNFDANLYHVLKDFDMDGIEAAARNRKKDGSYLLSDEQFKERYSVLNLDSLNTASTEYQSAIQKVEALLKESKRRLDTLKFTQLELIKELLNQGANPTQQIPYGRDKYQPFGSPSFTSAIDIASSTNQGVFQTLLTNQYVTSLDYCGFYLGSKTWKRLTKALTECPSSNVSSLRINLYNGDGSEHNLNYVNQIIRTSHSITGIYLHDNTSRSLPYENLVRVANSLLYNRSIISYSSNVACIANYSELISALESNTSLIHLPSAHYNDTNYSLQLTQRNLKILAKRCQDILDGNQLPNDITNIVNNQLVFIDQHNADKSVYKSDKIKIPQTVNNNNINNNDNNNNTINDVEETQNLIVKTLKTINFPKYNETLLVFFPKDVNNIIIEYIADYTHVAPLAYVGKMDHLKQATMSTISAIYSGIQKTAYGARNLIYNSIYGAESNNYINIDSNLSTCQIWANTIWPLIAKKNEENKNNQNTLASV